MHIQYNRYLLVEKCGDLKIFQFKYLTAYWNRLPEVRRMLEHNTSVLPRNKESTNETEIKKKLRERKRNEIERDW